MNDCKKCKGNNCPYFNHELTQTCTYNDCPLGGDISNNCADCDCSREYRFANGECVKR